MRSGAWWSGSRPDRQEHACRPGRTGLIDRGFLTPYGYASDLTPYGYRRNLTPYGVLLQRLLLTGVAISTCTLQEVLMRIRSINDVSAAVRGRRLDMGLSQSDLSERSGISRKWISEFESGKPTAEFALVMRVLEALDIHIELTGTPTSAALMSASGTLSASAEVSPSPDRPVDLDALLEEYRGG